MTIAVTGSSGHSGRLIIEKLRTRLPASDVIAIARTPARAVDLRVAVRQADYGNSSMLATAVRGIRELVLASANELGQRAAQHRNAVEAAKTAGVRRIVHTSLLHADRSPPSLAAEHFETERALRASGLESTILRNGWYPENCTNSVHGARAAGSLVGGSGDGRISAARADYAEAAVAVLTSLGHDGKSCELAGDDSFTLGDLAAELSRQAGRKIAYRNVPESEYATVLAKDGIPDAIAKARASWDVGIAAGALFDNNGELRRLIGRRTTPLKEFVARRLARTSPRLADRSTGRRAPG
jgi:NAD(P)H dehydrogenase (quinone)